MLFDDEPRPGRRRTRTVGLLAAAAIVTAGGCGAAAGGPRPGGSAGTAGTANTGGSAGAGGVAGGGGRGGSVPPPPATLLVDADQSSNNDDPTFPPSYSDALFEVDLAVGKIPHDTIVIPSPGTAARMAFPSLAPYRTVLWYTADATTDLFSADQQAAVEQWLDLGQKTLLIFSENLLSDLGSGGTWTAPTDNALLSRYLGAPGWAADGLVDVAGTGAVSLKGRIYTVDGATGAPLAGMHFEVFSNTPLDSTADLVNPGPDTTVLATTDADPADTGINSATPIIVGHAVGTSMVIYVGMPVENVDGAPLNSITDLVNGVLQFAGLL